MKQTEIIMGMPVTVEIADRAEAQAITNVFDYFHAVDRRYSPYKKTSEVSKVNNGADVTDMSAEFQWVLDLCEQTKTATNDYFDIRHRDGIDPSGLVKGWAIQNAANQLRLAGFKNFYIEAGGDLQVDGLNKNGQPWSLGIRNPFDLQTIVKRLVVSDRGVATSGTYFRGNHIYNPRQGHRAPEGIHSLTVVGPNVYDADRFATAAFAMGIEGMSFIDSLQGFEAYMIDDTQTATFTAGFAQYVA